MKVGMVTSSVSRGAGGIFEIIRSYSQLINRIDDVEVSVFSLTDKYASEDIGLWRPIEPRVFSTIGPKSFGFAPYMMGAMLKSDVDICHLHVLWKYTSVAT